MTETKTPLQRAQEVRAARAAAGELERLDPMEHHLADRGSRAKAVAAKCFDCVGGKCADNGYRRAIRECPSAKCPLYAFRPYR